MTTTATSVHRGAGYWSFVALMLALTGLFLVLGFWQMERLGEKEALIEAVASRVGTTPAPLPETAAWAGIDPAALEFTPLEAIGSFVPDQTIRVFTALGGDVRGRYSGPGYWHLTPFRLAQGGTLLVNRGFVPNDPPGLPVSAPPAGEVRVHGLARRSEAASMFTPAPDPAKRIEWVRDVERLAAMLPTGFAPVFPLTLDLPAGAPGELPQAGETVIEFPNNHLGYAMTWFGFAILTPIMLAFWMRRGGTARPQD